MNLPNKLTLLRLILIPFIIIFLYIDNLYTKIFALTLFIIAIITDFLDGKISRKRNLKTKFGVFMDPVADKILIISLLVVFTELGLVPAWMTIIIIAREFIISGIRTIAAAEGKIIPANIWGKIKAGVQMFAVTVTLFLIIFEFGTRISYMEINTLLNMWMHPIIYLLIFIATVTTLISMIGYVKILKGTHIKYG